MTVTNLWPLESLQLRVGNRSPSCRSHRELAFSALACGISQNADQPLVICLHGFPDHRHSFRFLLPKLAQAGYRAIAPNLRGYQPSSQPKDKDYSLVAIAGDVLAWADQLGAKKIHLIGHDWGAAIAYVAGALYPQRFFSLTTLAVPHSARLTEAMAKVPGQYKKSWYMMFFQLPIIAELAVQANDWALIRRLWKNWSPNYTLGKDEWAQLRQTFCAPGVKQAMLAYYRQNLSLATMLGRTDPAAQLTQVPVRTLAITGVDDGCIDTKLYEHAFQQQDFPQGFRIERINNAGHFAHLEQPEPVNQMIINWLAQKP